MNASVVKISPKSLSVIRRCFARPWKLNVNTYSPLRVSLWRTRNTPWLPMPPCNTIALASDRGNVPWNLGDHSISNDCQLMSIDSHHGYSLICDVKSDSCSKSSSSRWNVDASGRRGGISGCCEDDASWLLFMLFTLLLFSVAVDGLEVEDEGAQAVDDASAIDPVDDISEVFGNDGFEVAGSSREWDGIWEVGVVFMQ